MPSLTPSSPTLARFAAQAVAWLREQRRGAAGMAVLFLGGFGLTALAVAPLAAINSLAPDPADLPRRMVAEALPLSTLAPQLRALAEQEFDLSRSTVSRSNDSLEALLARLGVIDAEAAIFLRRDAVANRALLGRGGRMLRARTNSAGGLIELSARFPAEDSALRGTHFNRLVVRRDEVGRWRARVEIAPFDMQLRLGAGTIRTSLFAATDAAEVPDAVAVQLAEIFAVDIDFHRELRRGDRFVVVYEVLSADGDPVSWNEGAGRVLAAEFFNGVRRHQAYWFAEPGTGAAGESSHAARGGYYGPDGSSRRRAFLASPLEFSRVTSGFAMRRDPINQNWRAHLGVDYAAPAGTPVRAVGDGTVESAGWMGGYGQTVKVQHGNGRETLYGHLSRIDVKRGDRVSQGQHLGMVGATGWATGPHLHFEFRMQGVHQDPIAIARNAEVVPLAPQALAQFALHRERSRGQLELAASLAAPAGAQAAPALTAQTAGTAVTARAAH